MSDFQAYLQEQLKDPEFRAMWEAYEQEKAQQLYTLARSIPAGKALQWATRAESEEERFFWAHIANMNLQRSQKIAIENNLF